MATIHQFDNNPEEDEFYLVEIYWFITYTLVEPSINQQFTCLVRIYRAKYPLSKLPLISLISYVLTSWLDISFLFINKENTCYNIQTILFDRCPN